MGRAGIDRTERQSLTPLALTMTNHRLLLALMIATGALTSAQERQPPKDSTRISLVGCTQGRSLIARDRGAEPVSTPISPGRRFRLSASKDVLAAIRERQGNVIEVTGLVKLSQFSPAPPGMPIGKRGRIRIGGGTINRDPRQGHPQRDPLVNETNEPVMAVESWRPLPERCPSGQGDE